MEKEMEGTYVGTVERELESNTGESNKTTAASQLRFLSTRPYGEINGHESCGL